ncbi:trigger factor [Elizabethkingia meningoseptica]|uniref:Trigger factor n=1 Tax=Elizabethkingia meningoseptica TaxID=238 RepID=A0A1V3U4E5_ELIME|nr:MULTISPECIES: trigger factor [Elizabethkingia]AQX11412.1 trigger factor [Elizabethkingia meningoseptica]MBG0512758.1 trigger factor [Elizabethkingia meningoseptica]MCL1673932.1 trigger factor [Elizabethkingia meningoseptica]MCL1685427.1 trigger factor [Elizabethkingia meningoseptica]MDE5432099.1 trigger factor [Elizabethkingia meningoseptica]
MKITNKNHDEVSALLTVTLEKSDYKEKVEKTLLNYAKNANIPGFRKGKAPLSLIRRQYEAGVAYEEINKQVSDALNNYINENNLRLVGQPVPQPVDELDYNNDEVTVAFEVGYEPQITIDLAKYEAPHYKVEASDKEISQSIENMQKRFAERVPQDKMNKDSYVALQIEQVVEEDAEGEHNHAPKNVTINKDNKEVYAVVKGKKVDESVIVTKEDLEKDETLAKELGFAAGEVEHLHHNEVKVTVKEIYSLDLAELNQDLFDKVYGADNIKSEEELKNKVKEELDEYFQQNADVHYVNKMLEQIVEKEEIQLPETFLIKWLMFNNPNIQSEEQAKDILENEKSQLKYQIIEGKLMNDNDVKIDYADILAQSEQLVRNQLAIYGIHHLSDEEVQKYAVEMLKDQEQVRQISSEVAMAKLKDTILEKGGKKEETISHDQFMEELKK